MSRAGCGWRVTLRGLAARVLLLALAGMNVARAQALRVGDAFPAMTARALDGGTMRLPDGHAAVVMVGFTQASGKDSGEWSARLAKVLPGVELDDVIVLDAVPGLMRGMVTAAIRHGMTPERQAHAAVVVKEGALWRARAQGADMSHAVLFAVDAGGHVRAVVSGPVTEAGVAEIRSALGGR